MKKKVFLILALALLVTGARRHFHLKSGGGSGPGTVATVLFSDNFATGDFSKWDFHSASDTAVVNDPAGSGSKVAQIHYTICGLQDGSCGNSHQDTNRWFAKSFSPNGLDHVVVKADVYFASPQNGGSQAIQRKMLYFMAPSGPGGNPNHYYSVLLDTFAGSWSGNLPTLTVTCDSVLLSGQPGCGSSKQYWSSPYFNFTYDAWHTVQYEVQVNTGDNPDGFVNVWVDGVKIMAVTGLQLRPSTYTTGITNFQIGDQADRMNYLVVDEYRYWKNISFATSVQ